MSGLIDDDVLHAFAIVGSPKKAAPASAPASAASPTGFSSACTPTRPSSGS
jgi:hypothetical protein